MLPAGLVTCEAAAPPSCEGDRGMRLFTEMCTAGEAGCDDIGAGPVALMGVPARLVPVLRRAAAMLLRRSAVSSTCRNQSKGRNDAVGVCFLNSGGACYIGRLHSLD